MWFFDIFSEHYTRTKGLCWVVKNFLLNYRNNSNLLLLSDIEIIKVTLETNKKISETNEQYNFRKWFAIYLFLLLNYLYENNEEIPNINIAQLVLAIYWVWNNAIYWKASSSNSDYNKAQKAIQEEFSFYNNNDINNINIWIVASYIIMQDRKNPVAWFHYMQSKFN